MALIKASNSVAGPVLVAIVSALFLASCGGGEDTAPTSGDTLPQVTDNKAIQYIEARGGWQCMGFKIKGGDKLNISSTGQWSGGQRDRASAGSNVLSKILYTDADGGNGLAYDAAGSVVPGISFAPQVNPICGTEPCNVTGLLSGSYCDPTLEQTIPNIQAAQRCSGATPLAALMVTIPGTPDPAGTPSMSLNPNNNRGATCSTKNRVISVIYGFPYLWVKANECLPINKNRLIGKIVSKDAPDLSAFAAFDVGKKYETLPYTVPADVAADSDICFKNNDTESGLGDNDGHLMVTVSRQ